MSARPLFLMGNKRSGSTLLVNLLNAHPRIFVSHESDIIWILYRASTGHLDEGECHPLDAARGMRSTLAGCRPIIDRGASGASGEYDVVGTFHRVLEHINRHGSDMDKPLRKSDLAWIGDKKPVQHSDPRLRGFMREHFPSARYLHVVRDPKGVVASISKAAAHWRVVPDHWKGSALDLLEQWAMHERWVLAVKEEPASSVHTLRLEDLCERPAETMERAFEFLDLDMPDDTARRILESVLPDPNRKYVDFDLPDSPVAREVMDIYGY